MKKRNKILVAIACILAVFAVLANIYISEEAGKAIETVQNIVINEIDITEEQEENAILEESKENASTTEIQDLSVEEEQQLEEQEIESEAFELQGNIAYEGDRAKSWDVELGDYAGLTYYSQVDNRWKNHVYTAIGDNSQTIGTSGCGPTSAAMIVSSIKGTITPDKLGDLFVENGYRSANSGTYWSAFRAVADEFDIEYQETSSFDTAIEKLKNNNYVVCSVGNGLFTYGGHFIVLVGIENDMIKIYDPYLYNGKFDTSTRRGKVTVSGNTVYCSIENFERYANFKGFFCYGYDAKEIIKENTTDSQVTTNTNIKNTVGNEYKIKATKLYTTSDMITGYNYKKNTKVVVLENVTSKIDKVKILKTGLIRFIYNSDYISTTSTTSNTTVSASVAENRTYTIARATKMYTSSAMTRGYNYKKGTKVVVLDNISSSISKVRVIKTRTHKIHKC